MVTVATSHLIENAISCCISMKPNPAASSAGEIDTIISNKHLRVIEKKFFNIVKESD
jgi:hypothetical protein